MDIILTCRGCGETETVKAVFSLTKRDMFRLEGYAKGWMIDGAGALCFDCKPAYPHPAQDESWSDYDRSNIVRELRAEGRAQVVEPPPEAKALADALDDAGY